MSGGLLWEVGVFNLLVCMHKQNAADKYEVFIVNYLTIYLPPANTECYFFGAHVIFLFAQIIYFRLCSQQLKVQQL